MEKQELTKNYYNFIQKRDRRDWVEKEVSTSKRQYEYNMIFKELLNLSLKNVECLTEEQTDIVRRYIGVYGNKASMIDIANNLNKSQAQVDRILQNASNTLQRRILRGYANLQRAVLNGEITKEELLDIRLDYIYKEFSSVIRMEIRGCETIRDVLEIPLREIKKCRSMGKKKLEGLVDYMHSLGLRFKDEEPFFEINNAIDSSNKNIYYEKENILNDKDESIKDLNIKISDADEIAYKAELLRKKIEELDSYEDRCDEIIEVQMNLKQQIQELRQVTLLALNVLGQGKVKTNIKK